MPQVGTRDLQSLRADPPLLARAALRTVPLELPGADVLQVMMEIDDRPVLDLLPRALHPTIPPTATFVFWRCPSSSVGSFTLAQVRVSCRLALRSRGLLLASYCDTAPAADLLRAHWGFDCRLGEVTLRRRYDRVEGIVIAEQRLILRVALLNPQIIAGADVPYMANLNLVRLHEGDEERLRLVQVDPEHKLERADRGRPAVEVFQPRAWAAVGVEPADEVVALHYRGELRLPPVRYLVDPDLPAREGTEHVGD